MLVAVSIMLISACGKKEKLYLTDSNGSGSIVPAETGTYAITLDIASLTFTMDKQ